MSQNTEVGLGHNPYASPVNDDAQPSAPTQLALASSGQRFATLVIDYVGVTLSSAVFGALWAIAGGGELAGLSSLLGLLVTLVYYAGLEATFGKTPGKMLVGTRVVTLSGGEPTFGQCLGRTVSRCVPFEPFSFLNAETVGWHDKWTNTRVIRTRTKPAGK